MHGSSGGAVVDLEQKHLFKTDLSVGSTLQYLDVGFSDHSLQYPPFQLNQLCNKKAESAHRIFPLNCQQRKFFPSLQIHVLSGMHAAFVMEDIT